MRETIEGLDARGRERIAALQRAGRFFWLDVTLGDTTRADLEDVLSLSEASLDPLLDFDAHTRPSRKFHADGSDLVFSFSCFTEVTPPGESSAYEPMEVHVLITGDFVLTLHEARVSLPALLAGDITNGGSEQYLVYAVLDAMVSTAFDALNAVELTLDHLQEQSTELRAARVRIGKLRAINNQLSRIRRQAGPQRGIFERISVEIPRVEGLEADSERYFERIGEQLNRLLDGVDAAADGVAKLIDLRLNETTYWLTVVATVFLPLTFITGFFGMNFGWMVEAIDGPLAFVLLGIGTPVLGVALVWALVRRRGTPVQR
jgi:magnesium transporter